MLCLTRNHEVVCVVVDPRPRGSLSVIDLKPQGSVWDVVPGAMVADQQVLGEWLSQPPDYINARGRDMYNWKNTGLKNLKS